MIPLIRACKVQLHAVQTLECMPMAVQAQQSSHHSPHAPVSGGVPVRVMRRALPSVTHVSQRCLNRLDTCVHVFIPDKPPRCPQGKTEPACLACALPAPGMHPRVHPRFPNRPCNGVTEG